MPRKIITSALAAEDLRVARKWLSQPGSGPRAWSRFARIREAIKDLRQAPCLWPAEKHPPLRERVVAGYRIVYEVVPDTGDNRTAGDVMIIRVLGPGQEGSLARRSP